MTYVIALPCVDLKDRACVEECPVDCIYEGGRSLYIHPEECIDCGACEPVCPVEAIFYEDDLPEQWKDYQAANAGFFDDLGSPRRRLQDRRHRTRPPPHRGAAAAGAGKLTSMTRTDQTAGDQPRRQALLEALRASDAPLGVTELAEQLGIHPNTVRFHLDALVTQGLVDRRLEEPTGRGPRTVHTPHPGMDRGGQRQYQLLAKILLGQLVHESRCRRRSRGRGPRLGRLL